MLDAIQDHLEHIYGIRCEYRAKDFLVDAESARALGGSARAREELLVSEGSEGLELALYVDPTLLQRVSEMPPLEGELGDFCEVAEGVSHFVYVAHTAELNRRVSLLELEAQAEVDKFAICTLLGWGGHVGRWAGTLVGRLFDHVQLRGHLDDAERWRCTEANRIAKRYCERLMPLVKNVRLDGLLSELRHMYRLGAEAKLQYFARP